MPWFQIHSTSSDISYGDWSKEKPVWLIPKIGSWKTKVVHDKRPITEDGTRWWELYIFIKDLADLQRLVKAVGPVILNIDGLEVYDDYRE